MTEKGRETAEELEKAAGTAEAGRTGAAEAETEELAVLYPGRHSEAARERLEEILSFALEGVQAKIWDRMEILKENPFFFRGRRLLFAVPLGENGINREYYELIAWLRSGKQVLSGALAGMVIDAGSELYTKAAARELAVAASMAGCAFVGRPLVEGTASLDNFLVQAANLKTDRMGAYRNSAKILARQLLEFQWQKKAHPKLLVLHASNHKTSNTLALWDQVKVRLSGVEIQEVNLRNGTLVDCSGCPYQMCLHFGERGQCFYGGPIVDDVYPAVKWADGILLLCPNYNDALSANMTAFINRLTALFRTTRFYEKAVFAIIVSGYSGSDLLAGQIATAMNMNKTFYLPGNFCMMETANQAGAALALPGIEDRCREFADRMRRTLLSA